MSTVLIYWWATGSFLRKLCRDIPVLYRNELSMCRNAILVARLLEEYSPSGLAMEVCRDEGSAFGSERYKQLLNEAEWVQKRFRVTKRQQTKEVN